MRKIRNMKNIYRVVKRQGDKVDVIKPDIMRIEEAIDIRDKWEGSFIQIQSILQIDDDLESIVKVRRIIPSAERCIEGMSRIELRDIVRACADILNPEEEAK